MEESKRHLGVVAESLRSDIRQIAEGHAVLRQELQGQREEVRDEFKETKALLRLSFGQLDQRVDSNRMSLLSSLELIASNPGKPDIRSNQIPPRAERFLSPSLALFFRYRSSSVA